MNRKVILSVVASIIVLLVGIPFFMYGEDGYSFPQALLMVILNLRGRHFCEEVPLLFVREKNARLFLNEHQVANNTVRYEYTLPC